MLQIIRHGIDITRHHLKGVYVCVVGKKRQPSAQQLEVFCTLREGRAEDEAGFQQSEGAKYCPIELGYQGLQITLRPWDPQTCVIAAAIYNRLIHFPIRPGSCIFCLDCSLDTLSHLADIVGVGGGRGAVCGIISSTNPKQPSEPDIAAFLQRNPKAMVVKADIQAANLETYERLLSIPMSSRYACLMGLHPRLGERSPLRILSQLDDPPKLFRRIFSFLENDALSGAKCLVVNYWPEGTKVDVIRNMVLSHVDILQRWRTPRRSHVENAKEGESGDDETTEREDGEEKPEGDDHPEEAKKRSKGDQDSNPQWVFLDLPLDNIVTSSESLEISAKLVEVVEDMKRLPGGQRTGLLAKEQLLLAPFFPNRALLLLKYAGHRDERGRKSTKKKVPAATGGNGLEYDEICEEISLGHRPPSAVSMPVPAFKKAVQSEPALAKAPAMVAPRQSAVSSGSSSSRTPPGVQVPKAGIPSAPPGLPDKATRERQLAESRGQPNSTALAKMNRYGAAAGSATSSKGPALAGLAGLQPAGGPPKGKGPAPVIPRAPLGLGPPTAPPDFPPLQGLAPVTMAPAPGLGPLLDEVSLDRRGLVPDNLWLGSQGLWPLGPPGVGLESFTQSLESAAWQGLVGQLPAGLHFPGQGPPAGLPRAQQALPPAPGFGQRDPLQGGVPDLAWWPHQEGDEVPAPGAGANLAAWHLRI